MGGLKRGMQSVFEGLKREVEEKVVYNGRVRGPVLMVAGFGLAAFGMLSPNFVVQNVSIPAGAIAVIDGTMDFALG